jgi:hypothetical protein
MKKTDILEEDQKKDVNNSILKIAIIESILVYGLWSFFPDPIGTKIYFIGMALSHFLLALYIRQISKPSFLTFFLFCITINNLLDEVLFNPLKIGWNEYIASAIIIIVYFLKDKPIE